MKGSKPAAVPGTYFFFNLGCPKNIVDAERIAAALEGVGWRESTSPQKASLLVVTTCAFISPAVEESVEEIIRVGRMKGEGQRLAVIGCLVSREGDALNGLLPEVDLFLSVDAMDDLAGRAAGWLGRRPESRGAGPPLAVRKTFTPPHIAYLKVSEGCSNRCSYCTIPSIRGELRSRAEEEILKEVEMLSAAAVRELVIVAQDTSAWGFDSASGGDLYGLLERIRSAFGEGWIRLMYLHPAHLRAEPLVSLIGRGIISPYLDIPIQHASDRILESMGRGYRRSDLERIFGGLRSGAEQLVLRTTVMVGYPGERKEDFLELLDFMEEISFDHVGVFVYSRERGTSAASLAARVPEGEAARRRDEALELQMDLSHERLAARVGESIEVLVDAFAEEGERPVPGVWGTGRFYGQAYDVDGVTFLSGRRCAVGSFVTACAYRAEAYDLYAEA